MSRKLLVLLAIPLVAACASEPEEEEMPVVESEVVVPAEDDSEVTGEGPALESDARDDDAAMLEPTDRSLANEAEDSVTAPAGEATGKIQPIE